ncbi:MAG: hypothetical protein K5989_05380 [Lachnospiraceae bacterium]|nr:hypothetical protein [Lachnospiraceae bacterium]
MRISPGKFDSTDAGNRLLIGLSREYRDGFGWGREPAFDGAFAGFREGFGWDFG